MACCPTRLGQSSKRRWAFLDSARTWWASSSALDGVKWILQYALQRCGVQRGPAGQFQVSNQEPFKGRCKRNEAKQAIRTGKLQNKWRKRISIYADLEGHFWETNCLTVSGNNYKHQAVTFLRMFVFMICSWCSGRATWLLDVLGEPHAVVAASAGTRLSNYNGKWTSVCKNADLGLSSVFLFRFSTHSLEYQISHHQRSPSNIVY